MIISFLVKMSHTCVLFKENGKKKMMTVPSNWVIGKELYWPPQRFLEKKLYVERADPEETWRSIPILKEVFQGKTF